MEPLDFLISTSSFLLASQKYLYHIFELDKIPQKYSQKLCYVLKIEDAFSYETNSIYIYIYKNVYHINIKGLGEKKII
jgi:hypothetical protein